MEEEVWKDVIGWEGDYEISTFGQIKSKGKHVETLMTPEINKEYYRVDLRRGQRRSKGVIHRLVAQTFIPNPNDKPCVNHKDGNKLNNHISNLEWCTVQENTVHAINSGLWSPIGSDNHLSKLSEEEAIKIYKLYHFNNKTLTYLGKQYNVTKQAINAIVKDVNWKHLNLKERFEKGEL